MKAVSLREDRFNFELSASELRVIIIGLREADEELQDWEFEKRTGFERSAMRELMAAILKKERLHASRTYRLEWSADEVRIILAGLRETVRTLEDWEFQTRTGRVRDSMRAFHDDILTALNSAEQKQDPSR